MKKALRLGFCRLGPNLKGKRAASGKRAAFGLGLFYLGLGIGKLGVGLGLVSGPVGLVSGLVSGPGSGLIGPTSGPESKSSQFPRLDASEVSSPGCIGGFDGGRCANPTRGCVCVSGPLL